MSTDNVTSLPRSTPLSLVTVDGISYSPEYWKAGRPHALDRLLLHPEAGRRLQWAQRLVQARSTRHERFDLHVWDGYRPYLVQLSIFNDYLDQLIQSGMGHAEAEMAATSFVRHPQSVYPHGTGGTVDLTLVVNGHLADMGTGFDDFTPQAHRAWYAVNTPCTKREHNAARYRRLLDAAMTAVGFVGIVEEWWHYEWGTDHWARTKNRSPLLITSPEQTHLAEEPAS